MERLARPKAAPQEAHGVQSEAKAAWQEDGVDAMRPWFGDRLRELLWRQHSGTSLPKAGAFEPEISPVMVSFRPFGWWQGASWKRDLRGCSLEAWDQRPNGGGVALFTRLVG